jgi:hypothetical protein
MQIEKPEGYRRKRWGAGTGKNPLVRFTLLGSLSLLGLSSARPCTIAVISGRATVDGRPLLWKNRDVTNQDNFLRYGQGGRYAFLGLVEPGPFDKVWAGLNSAGLAIVNAVSTDLDGSSESENGVFIKRVLEECATVRDVELLLTATNGQRKTMANFGVIDALGEGAIFEAGNARFAKFDAAEAPYGFLVRTNYALTGTKPGEGEGFIRFDRATAILTPAAEARGIDVRFLFDRAARDLVNESVDPYPLPFKGTQSGHPPGYLRTDYSINRYKTASASVVHGVRAGDDPSGATLWCILGEPVCGIALPLWVKGEEVPFVLGGALTAPLRDLVKFAESRCYGDPSSDRFLDTTKLVDELGRGLLRVTSGLENVIFRAAAAAQERWRTSGADKVEVRSFQERLAAWAYRRYAAFL